MLSNYQTFLINFGIRKKKIQKVVQTSPKLSISATMGNNRVTGQIKIWNLY